MIASRVRHIIVLAVLIAIAALGAQRWRPAAPSSAIDAIAPAAAALFKAPLSFEPNVGQAPAGVSYLSRGPGYALQLGRSGADLRLDRGDGESMTIGIAWRNGAAASAVTAEGQLDGVVHYLSGRDESAWRRDVPTFSKVRQRNVYDGIDAVFYGNPQRLEYDLIVAPGGDPAAIAIGFDGVDAADVDPDTGDLLLRTGDRFVRQQAPVAYQDTPAGRREVASRYDVDRDGVVRVMVEAFDRTLPLVIDPVIDWSTYLGGSNREAALGLALNSKGELVVAGGVDSTGWSLAPGATRAGGTTDAYVSRFSATGTHLSTTFLGGSGNEVAADVAIDSFDNIYLVGTTNSMNFPTTANAPMRESASLNVAFGIGLPFLKIAEWPADTNQPVGDFDAFMTKLDASGKNTLYSTYYGGSPEVGLKLAPKPTLSNPYIDGKLQFTFNPGAEAGAGIAVDNVGNVYIVGHTWSDAFPTTDNAFKKKFTMTVMAPDGFLVKLDTNKSGVDSIKFSSYLGGSCWDSATDVALDRLGRVYVVGTSDYPGVPICGGFATTPGAAHADRIGGRDAFVAKFVISDAQVGAIYSTFVGSSVKDRGGRIGVDHVGNAYATFITESDGNAPPILQLVSLNPTGTQERWNVYLADMHRFPVGFSETETTPHGLHVSGTAGASRLFVVKNTATGPMLYHWKELLSDIAAGLYERTTPLNAAGSGTLGAAAVVADGRRVFLGGTAAGASLQTANAAQGANAGGNDAFIVGLVHASPPTLSPRVIAPQKEGEGFTADVAGFSRSAASAQTVLVGDISWGDGTKSPVWVHAGAGGVISGNHIYQDNGTFFGRVCVNDFGAPAEEPPVCSAFNVSVANQPPAIALAASVITPTTPGAVFTSTGSGFTLNLANVATIQDPGGFDTHTATIKWGSFYGENHVEVFQGTHKVLNASNTYIGVTPETIPAAELCVRDDDNAQTCKSFTIDPPIADLSLERFDLPGAIAECSVVGYRLKVTNHGPDTALNVGIRDLLADPSRMSYVGAMAVGGSADGTISTAQQLTERNNGGFGRSVAIQGATAVVGDSAGATIYERNPADFRWSKVALLGGDGLFGDRVAMRGDWMAVARRGFRRSPTQLVPGEVRIYRRVNGAWGTTPVQILTPPALSEAYGSALAVGDEFLAVGDNQIENHAGAVHTYRLQGDTWVYDASLAPVNNAAAPQFGAAIAMTPNGRLLAVGTPFDNSIPTTQGPRAISGSVYVFRRDGTQWVADGMASTGSRLAASSFALPQSFGAAVAMNEDNEFPYLVIGAPNDPGGSGNMSGRAFVFRRVGANQWLEMTSMFPHDSAAGARFGTAVDISGTRALIGTGPSFAQGGLNPFQDRAYLFDVTNGTQIARLRPAAVQEGDQFGSAVAISGAEVVIGAPRRDFGHAYVFSSCGQPFGGGGLQCNVGSLASGASAEFLVSVKIGNGFTATADPFISRFTARAFGGSIDPTVAELSTVVPIANGACPGTTVDITPPVIVPTVSGGAMGNDGWFTGGIIDVSWTVSDPESPITSTQSCTTATVSEDTAGATFTCSAASAGGSSTHSVTIKRDSVAPSIVQRFEPDQADANRFVASYTCDDPSVNGAASGMKAVGGCPSAQALNPGQLVSAIAEDAAGNTSSVTGGVPSAQAGADRTVPIGDQCRATVTLSAAGSLIGGGPAAYAWTGDGELFSSAVEFTRAFAAGRHVIELALTNGSGVTSRDTVIVTVEDTQAPAFANIPDRIVTPATGLRTPVSITPPTVTDNCDFTVETNLPEEGFLTGFTTVWFRATDTSGNSATAITPVVIEPRVDVGVAVEAQTLNAGAIGLHTIVLTNAGPSDAYGTVVKPVYGAGLAAVKAATGDQQCVLDANGAQTCTPVTLFSREALCTMTADGLSCTVPVIHAGDTLRLNLSVEAALDPPAAVPMTVSAITQETDTNAANDAASSDVRLRLISDLSLSMQGPASIVAGGNAAYQVTISNAGPSVATLIQLELSMDKLTPGAALPANCAMQSPKLVCVFDQLAAGSQLALPLSMTLDPSHRGLFFQIIGTVSSADLDPNSANNRGIALSGLSVSTDRSVQLSAGPLVAGEVGSLTIAAANAGPSTANNVRVRVAESADLPFTTPLPQGCSLGIAASGPEVTCAAGAMAPQASVVWTLPIRIDAAYRGAFSTTATVSAAEIDSNAANDTAGVTAPVDAIANLAVTLGSIESPVVAGRTAMVTASITNLGPSSATGVTVAWDEQPPLSLGALDAGATTDLAGETAIDPFARGHAGIAATVSAAESDSDALNNRATANVALTAEADLAVTMTASDSAQAGGALTYGLRVVNHGPSGATAIDLQQLLPDGVSFDSAAACAPSGANRVACAIERLAPAAGESRTVLVRIAPAFYGSLTSTASAAGAETDPDLSSNDASLTRMVENTLDVAIEVSARPSALVAGQRFAYEVVITNRSVVPVSNLELTHRLPIGITAGVMPEHCSIAAGLITCLIERLDGQATATLSLPVMPVTPGSFTAVSGLRSDGDDIDLSNNAATTTVLVGSQGRGPLGAGDFDGDGDLDLAVADNDDHLVKIYLYEASGFVLRDRVRVGRRPEALAIGDLDEDGDLDIATINRQRSDVSIVENDGRGNFAETSRPDLRGASPVAITIGDFTGDGRLDIVAALRDADGIALLTRGADQRWREIADERRPRFRSRWCQIVERPSALAAGDFDADGDLDLALLARPGRSLALLTNDGAGRFTETAEVPVHNSRLHDDIAVGDYDEDGDLDLAITGLSHHRITLLANAGGARFAPAATTRVGRKPEAIAAGDITGDGRLDLVTANRNDDSVSVAVNVDGRFPNGSVTEQRTIRKPIALILGDFTGDGRLDLVVMNDKHDEPVLMVVSR